MEILTIATPGEPSGPCRGSCSHPACLSVRQLASERCPQCHTLLGFGSKVTGSPPMHLRCARKLGIVDEDGPPQTSPRPNRPI